ncbi:MAG: PqqD family protein [Acidimicrobiales bacterium]
MLLDPESGSTHVLNAAGRVFWSGLDGRTPLRELIEDLADAVGGPDDELTEPVLAWAHALGSNGLLEGVAPTGDELLGIDGRLPEGAALPKILGRRLDGGDALPGPVLRDRPTVLLNWSFGCGFCLAMVGPLREVVPLLHAQDWDVTLLVAGAREDVETAARTHGLAGHVVLVEVGEGDPFHALGTPVASVVDGDGIVQEPLAVGAAEVPAMLRRLAGLAPDAAPVPVDAERSGPRLPSRPRPGSARRRGRRRSVRGPASTRSWSARSSWASEPTPRRRPTSSPSSWAARPTTPSTDSRTTRSSCPVSTSRTAGS